VRKGRLIFAEGRLRIRSYTDRNGIRRRTSEVVLSRFSFWFQERRSAKFHWREHGKQCEGTEDVDAMDILNEVESKLQEQDSDDLVDLDENFDVPF